MLDVQCPDYLTEVKAFAEKTGRTKQLQEQLDYLDTFAGRDKTRCVLRKDFAPMSFDFIIFKKKDDGSESCWFNGGLIFHGNHDGFGSGSAPTFSVTLNPTDGWSIHT